MFRCCFAPQTMPIKSNLTKHCVECVNLNIITDKVTFADAFADVEPAEDFDGDQSVQPGLANGGLLPCTGGGALDQFTQTFEEKCQTMNSTLARAQVGGGCLPARMAGMSLTFGGVSSCKAYRWITFNVGRAWVSRAVNENKQMNICGKIMLWLGVLLM